MESGKPFFNPENFVPVTDESGRVTILVNSRIAFKDNIILVEHFTFRGRDIFISRTALKQ